jgi:hypothetical protein
MGILYGMNLSEITMLIGGLAIAMAVVGLVKADLLRGVIRGLPRNRYAGWVLAGLCCWLGAREALLMNMGGLNGYKNFIFVLAPLVFIGSVTCLKELLAARALGGLLCLIAVPVTRVAVFSDRPYFQIISVVAYSWVVVGIIWLMAPWRFRQMHQGLLEHEGVYRFALAFKALVGAGFIALGLWVY